MKWFISILFAAVLTAFPVTVKAASINVNYSGTPVFISGIRIQAYDIDGKLAVRCEDLADCGFDTIWDGRGSVFRVNHNPTAAKGTPVGIYFTYWNGWRFESEIRQSWEKEPDIKTSGIAGVLIDSDIRVVLNGVDIDAYFIEGSSFILVDDFAEHGYNYGYGSDDSISLYFLDNVVLNSDIGPVDITGLEYSRQPPEMTGGGATRMEYFAPQFDGFSIKTSNPYAIWQGFNQTINNPPGANVPLLATLEALGLGWEWDYNANMFTVIYDGYADYELYDGETDSMGMAVGDYSEIIAAIEIDMSFQTITSDREHVKSGSPHVSSLGLSKPYLYDGVVYVQIQELAALLGWESTRTNMYQAGYMDKGLGEIRFTFYDKVFNQEHIFELAEYTVRVDGDTFIDHSPTFSTKALRVTNRGTGEERIYIPMNTADKTLTPDYSFAYSHSFGGRFRADDINAFLFTIYMPEDWSFDDAEKTGTYQYGNRNADMYFTLAANQGEITGVRGAPVYFAVENVSLTYFDAPGESFGMTTSAIRDTGLFYDDTLYVSIEFLAQAFGYRFPTVRAVVVFAGETALSAEMTAGDMAAVMKSMFSFPTRRDVTALRPEELDRYINFYNSNGEKWTVWFRYGQPLFLDAAYGEDRFIWRQWDHNPRSGDESGARAAKETESIIEGYKTQAAVPGEPYNTAADILILPKDEQKAAIVKDAAAKNLFPVGWLDYGIDLPVTQAEFLDLIAMTLSSATYNLVVAYVYSPENLIYSLVYGDNAKTYIDWRSINADPEDVYPDIFQAFGKYPLLAVYIHSALEMSQNGITLHPDASIPYGEAGVILNAVLTLYTGEKEYIALTWFGEYVGNVTRLKAVAAMLKLYDFVKQTQID